MIQGPSKLIDLDNPVVLESRTRILKHPNLRYRVDVDSVSAEEYIGDPHEVQRAIEEEFRQLVEIGAWHPIHSKDATVKPIPSKMLLKRKLDSNGNLLKVKARFVGGGHMQPSVNPNPSSSPAALKSTVVLVCGIGALQSRNISTADFTGAYLLALMKYNVVIEINRQLTAILTKMYPDYSSFVEQGKLLVKLDRALYGCKESALLWYEEVSSFLLSIGFRKSDEDDCLFLKGHGEDILHLVLFIDDLLSTCKNLQAIKSLEESLIAKYKTVTFKYGNIHEYLGAQLDFSTPMQVTIKMVNKVEQLLKDFNISQSATSPAAAHLMQVRDLPPLPTSQQIKLRSAIAKLLYLSINTRPDICLPVNFLCARVGKLDEDDEKKFLRILYYLNGTRTLGLTLKFSSPRPTINIYADASYGVNSDRKSQTGLCVQLDSATIIARSGKQKLVTKSSTEAELVACSDSVSYGISLLRLLSELEVPNKGIVVHQDNLSTLSLIQNNKSTSQRTLHIDVRYFFLRDRLLRKQLSLVHTPTERMVADILTKPIQGTQFNVLRNLMMHCDD
jgi:hypothetical protein